MKDGQLTIGVKAATAKVSAAEQVVKRNLTGLINDVSRRPECLGQTGFFCNLAPS